MIAIGCRIHGAQRPRTGEQSDAVYQAPLRINMAEFADRFDLEIHLVYYPPYHSKYNPIERMWGILGNHWNGTLLVDRETAIEWAKTMTWKGISPRVKILDKVFETGAKAAKKAFQVFQDRLQRNPLLSKWDIPIKPEHHHGQTLG